jgi:spore coat polysaccharide biosynthesis protein SpsF
MTGRLAGIVLQARLASTRLPGKALALIGHRSILELCLRRLMASAVAPVVLATTDRPEDEALAAVAAGAGAAVFRGSATDVLGRYVRCASELQLEHVIRATADNPGVDRDAPVRVLAALREHGADYVFEEGLPCGAAVEGVTREALARAAVLATDPYDREHVTTFIRRRTDLFRAIRLPAPPALVRPDVRLTVDTEEDLRRVRQLFADVPLEDAPVLELIRAWDRAVQRWVA